MTRIPFAATLLAFLFASYANAWDMGAYVENAHAGEGIKDTAFVWKDEQAKPEADEDSSMALTQEKKEKYKEIKQQKRNDKKIASQQNTDDRQGFFFSTGLSVGYSSLSNTEGGDRYYSKNVNKFSGLSIPFIETRFGIYIAKIVSVHIALGLGLESGNYEGTINNRDDKANVDAISLRGIAGLGAEFYPFQDKESALYGLYLGLCVGGASQRVQADEGDHTFRSEERDLDSFATTFARIEIGYDFRLGKRWRIGPAFSYTFGKYDTDDDDSLITKSHNISLGIRFAR